MGATIAFAGGGLLIICIGLTYAELATAIPETGGGVAFVQRAYNNKPLSFLAGWSVLFGYMSVIAFEAVALPTVIDYVTPIQHHVRLWNIAGSEIYLTWALIGVQHLNLGDNTNVHPNHALALPRVAELS